MKMMATINVTNQAIHIQFQIVKDFVFLGGRGRGLRKIQFPLETKKMVSIVHIQNAAYSSKESRRFFSNGGHRILFDCIQYYATLIYL